MKRESAEKRYMNINCKKLHNLYSQPLVISVIMMDMMGATVCSYEDTKVHRMTTTNFFFSEILLEFYAQQFKLSFTSSRNKLTLEKGIYGNAAYKLKYSVFETVN
jgi:hypothetical protein